MNSTIPSLERYGQKCYKKNYSFSLSSFMTFFLLSLSLIFLLSFSASPFIFCHSIFHFSSSFFSKIFTSPFFFSFFFPFLSLSLSPPKSLPLRLVVTVEFGLTDEVDWWRSHVSLGFCFSQLWIACYCGWWWSWVDSM